VAHADTVIRTDFGHDCGLTLARADTVIRTDFGHDCGLTLAHADTVIRTHFQTPTVKEECKLGGFHGDDYKEMRHYSSQYSARLTLHQSDEQSTSWRNPPTSDSKDTCQMMCLPVS
jgi:hypothetical protein